MTNADKYLKDGEVGNFVQAFSCWYYGITRELENADKVLAQFLKAEAKPTLTEDERVILRNIKYTALDKIKRTDKGALYIEHFWIDYGEQIRFLYDNLFQFIKERRRI